MYEHSQPSKPSLSSFDWEYPFISKNGLKSNLEKELENKQIPGSLSSIEANRWQSTNLYEKENIWGEIRSYSDHLRRYASEVPHPEVTREKFFEIYNLAVGLLRAIDCLDPDYKMRKPEQPNPYPNFQSSETDMSRRSIDFRSRENLPLQNFSPYSNNNEPPTSLYYQQNNSFQVVPFQNQMQVPMKNLTGEVFFDDLADSERYAKRKRKKPLYSVNRNLYCHICFVRETPEWRRGPDGDHTLCNACGLHYAKNQKKEKLAREGRKHSIDMLLCENSNGSNNNGSNSTGSNSSSNSNSNLPLSSTSSITTSTTSTSSPTISMNIPFHCNNKQSEFSNETLSPRRSFDNSRYSYKNVRSPLDTS